MLTRRLTLLEKGRESAVLRGPLHKPRLRRFLVLQTGGDGNEVEVARELNVNRPNVLLLVDA
jgi:hypothetical protein